MSIRPATIPVLVLAGALCGSFAERSIRTTPVTFRDRVQNSVTTTPRSGSRAQSIGGRVPARATKLFRDEVGGVAPTVSTRSVAAAVSSTPRAAVAPDAAVVDPAIDAALRLKLDANLYDIVANGGSHRARIIVQTSSGASERRALTTAGIAVTLSDTARGIIVANATPDEIVWLATRMETLRVSTDATITATQAPYTDGERLRRSLGLKKDGHLTRGSGSFRGDKVTVAVIDSGIEISKDLERKRVLAFFDWTKTGRATAVEPYDDYGHGTHVASLIAGTGDLSKDRFRGHAHRALLVGYKVLDSRGSGYTSHAIAAIDHAIANRTTLGIKVINLSLGHPIMESAKTDPFVRAVDRAVAAGIVVVASAGNHGINSKTGFVGYGGITVPGNALSAITVGAVDIKDTVTRGDDTVQAYSSRGPTWFDGFAKPDLVAPGHRLVGTAAKDSTLYSENADLRVSAQNDGAFDYLRLSGTSMAAAVTSGIVAAGLSAFYHENDEMALTPNAVKAILQYTAVHIAGEQPLSQGAGALNPLGALRFIREFAKTKRSEWSLSALIPYDVTDTEERLVWSQQIMWGDHILWGEQIMWGDHILWGEQIMWGDHILWGEQIMWGDSIVWDNQILWGEQILWADSIAIDTGSGVMSGSSIEWGSVQPSQVRWAVPDSGASAGLTILSVAREP